MYPPGAMRGRRAMVTLYWNCFQKLAATPFHFPVAFPPVAFPGVVGEARDAAQRVGLRARRVGVQCVMRGQQGYAREVA